MRYLYKISGKPNYPVLSKAFIIFWSYLEPTKLPEVWAFAKEINESGDCYCYNMFEDNTELQCLGSWEPTPELAKLEAEGLKLPHVIHSENGEY